MMDFRTATIHNTNSEGAQLVFSGETTATVKRYKRISSYTPAVGDRVLLAPVSGTWLIIGKIV